MPYKLKWIDEDNFEVILEAGTWAQQLINGHRSDMDLLFCPNKVGRYLRELRGKKNYSLRTVSAGTGLSVSHISRIETEKTQGAPGTRSLKKIASFYGIGTDTLLLISGMSPIDDALSREFGEASLEARFIQLVCDERLKPDLLNLDDLKWLAPEWKRAWLDFSQNLVHAIQAGESLPAWLTEDPGSAS